MKWLRFRLFRFGPFSLKHFTDFDSFLKSLSSTSSEDQKKTKTDLRLRTSGFIYYSEYVSEGLAKTARL